MPKYEATIHIRRFRFGVDSHSEYFDSYKDAKQYIECVKRDQPHLMSYSIRKIEEK